MENKQKQKEKAICVRSINLFFSLALYPQPQQCIPLPKIKKAFQTKKKIPKKSILFVQYICHEFCISEHFCEAAAEKKNTTFFCLARSLTRAFSLHLSLLPILRSSFFGSKERKKNTNLLLKL